ncbi:MAG: glycosyltransferase [Thaumarchaeota archaeon]|nr:glycosyltransferase [Candidatus Calditenuaceae archaeon]MDW8041955.1 glycosyltransferase [Nitrososphaerota archaeon]
MRARRVKRIGKLAVLLLLVSVSLVLWTKTTLVVIAWAITVIYTVWGIFHTAYFLAGRHRPYVPNWPALRKLKFSIIVPARNEPIIERTVNHIIHEVHYPKHLKEVIAVVDDEGTERIVFHLQQLYPWYVKPLARRMLFPTKPSALNDALALATGDVIGIADVEDLLDNDVLEIVNAAVVNDNHKVLQVILRISNVKDSWITEMFACEYAGWFRVLLNGRSRLGLYAPLGGTGNYLERTTLMTVAKWDPLNLAEDAELALRLHLHGFKTVVLDARHWEEAPVDFRAWLKQRTRWFRGWLQSLFTHGPSITWMGVRHPRSLINVISILMMLVAPLIVIFNWVAYSMTAIYLLEYFDVIGSELLSDVFPQIAILPLFFNVLYYLVWYLGKELEGIPVSFLRRLPHFVFYANVMMPVAALRSLYQELFKDVFWEKTRHPGRGARWATVEKA